MIILYLTHPARLTFQIKLNTQTRTHIGIFKDDKNFSENIYTLTRAHTQSFAYTAKYYCY